MHSVTSRGMVWGGRREEGSGWGTHVYLWRIHFNIWQNQYNIVKFKNKIKKKISIKNCYIFFSDYSHFKLGVEIFSYNIKTMSYLT